MTERNSINGAIIHDDESKKQDYLFRVSLKAVILDEKGHVLVVKERGRDWWDLPGGGIDHGETIKGALARELYEEVSMKGDFDYQTILTEDPHYLEGGNLYQIRVTFIVKPDVFDFGPGEDGDEVKFVDPVTYKNSEIIAEQKVFEYSQLAKR